MKANFQETPRFDPRDGLRLGAFVQLKSVRMLELNCGLRATQPVAGDLRITADVGVGWTRVPGGFACAARVEVEARESEAEDHLVFECETAYELTYEVPENSNPSDTEIVSFALTSATMSAWPYLREAVQSASVRCGLQPIILEVLRQPIPLAVPQES